MIAQSVQTLADLYERDETAWLEVMAELAAERRVAELDLANLSEYLTSMGLRDRREVNSRLVVLLTHFLKWEFQPELRGNSWRGTIREQRRELRMICESGTLRNHAEDILDATYADAVMQAADETGLALGTFPVKNPWDLNLLLADAELPV
jgi:hypothetical protein